MDEEMKGVEDGEKKAAERDPHNSIHTVANVYHNHECVIPTNRKWWQATVGLKNPTSSLFAWLYYINADHCVCVTVLLVLIKTDKMILGR